MEICCCSLAGLDAVTIKVVGGWKTRAIAERYNHAASMWDAMDTLQTRLSGRTGTKLHGPTR